MSLISIIMPMKNAMPYLVECLDSICGQDYTNWELLICDDHSTDTSYRMALSLAAKDHRISVYKNKGSGIISALKTAYAHANGHMVSRMDADDIMAKNRISHQFKDLNHHGLGHIALGLVKYFRADGLGNGYKKYEEWLNMLTIEGINWTEKYKECCIPSPCWMVYKSDFDRSGGFDHNLYPEDYDLCFRFKKRNLKCIPSSRVLHHWRDHSTRASRNDANYSDNNFISLKVKYFIELDLEREKNLILWGAGKKGKCIAQCLNTSNISFYWISNNPKKIGQKIHESIILTENDLKTIPNPQVIIAVAKKDEIINIERKLLKLQLTKTNEVFWFC